MISYMFSCSSLKNSLLTAYAYRFVDYSPCFSSSAVRMFSLYQYANLQLQVCPAKTVRVAVRRLMLYATSSCDSIILIGRRRRARRDSGNAASQHPDFRQRFHFHGGGWRIPRWHPGRRGRGKISYTQRRATRKLTGGQRQSYGGYHRKTGLDGVLLVQLTLLVFVFTATYFICTMIVLSSIVVAAGWLVVVCASTCSTVSIYPLHTTAAAV